MASKSCATRLASRPSLYRMMTVVMTDGSTFKVPSALRIPGNHVLLERDPANHPVYLGTSDSEGLMTRREEARMAKIREKNKMDLFGDDDHDLPQQKGS